MIETRDVNRWELRDSNTTSPVLEGWPCVFNASYEISGLYSEEVRPGAFRDDLRRNPDVCLLVNHSGLPLSRTTNGSVTLTEDSRGLHCRVALDPTEDDARAVIQKMRSRKLDGQMSFAFVAEKQSWSDDLSERTIEQVSINRGDVSLVTQAANPSTTSTIRSLEQRRAHIEQVGSEFRASSYELRLPCKVPRR